MKKHIFRRIFLIYLAALLLSAVFIEFYITNVLRSGLMNNLKNSLLIQADILSDSIAISQESPPDRFCGLIKGKTGERVTLIDISGKVLCDSDNDPSNMDNHAGRVEIQQAILANTGWSVRYSNTLKYDFLYVAKRVRKEEQPDGFIRLAVPLKDINDSVNALRLRISLVIIALFLLSGFILLWQMEIVRRLVIRISEYAAALAHGFFRKRLYLEGAGEFTELANNINEMASKLESSFTQKEEEKNRLDVIIRNAPEALLLINSEGIIELSNNTAKKLFGVSKMAGKPLIEVVRNPEFLSLVETVKQSRASSAAEITVEFPEDRYFAVTVSPISYKIGEISGVVAIFHDITRLKRLEEMRKDFVANVSHEIKTPVTAIRGFAETLLDGALYDKEHAEKFLQTIKTHSERLNRLVDDLLVISSVELGVVKMNRTDLNTDEMIKHIIETVTVQAAEKALTLRASVSQGARIIHADKDRFEQILLNLVDNAIKFTEKGEIEIGSAVDDGRKYFFVRDTGVGIPKRYLSRIGERFFRVDPSRSRDMGGTGLGLAIVKHLVKAHNWDIRMESEEGKGTTVKIYYS